MNATESYIRRLANLKAGEMSLLRLNAGLELDETVQGFDLFAGLWWPLRQQSPRAPRRDVAWLIAKLYCFRPIAHSPGDLLASQLAKCLPVERTERYQARFDRLLTMPLSKIEPELRWALDVLASSDLTLDWVRLTDDLSRWEKLGVRLEWATDFLRAKENR